MRIGIVGAGTTKFNDLSKVWAQRRILEVLGRDNPQLVMTGQFHSDGVCQWAIHEARQAGIETTSILLPAKPTWEQIKGAGKQIAEETDKVVCIVVRRMPVNNMHKKGRPHCAHCAKAKMPAEHVQSSGCWAMQHARSLGKEHQLILVGN